MKWPRPPEIELKLWFNGGNTIMRMRYDYGINPYDLQCLTFPVTTRYIKVKDYAYSGDAALTFNFRWGDEF